MGYINVCKIDFNSFKYDAHIYSIFLYYSIILSNWNTAPRHLINFRISKNAAFWTSTRWLLILITEVQIQINSVLQIPGTKCQAPSTPCNLGVLFNPDVNFEAHQKKSTELPLIISVMMYNHFSRCMIPADNLINHRDPGKDLGRQLAVGTQLGN